MIWMNEERPVSTPADRRARLGRHLQRLMAFVPPPSESGSESTCESTVKESGGADDAQFVAIRWDGHAKLTRNPATVPSGWAAHELGPMRAY